VNSATYWQKIMYMHTNKLHRNYRVCQKISVYLKVLDKLPACNRDEFAVAITYRLLAIAYADKWQNASLCLKDNKFTPTIN